MGYNKRVALQNVCSRRNNLYHSRSRSLLLLLLGHITEAAYSDRCHTKQHGLCDGHMDVLSKSGGTDWDAIWRLTHVGPRNHVLNGDKIGWIHLQPWWVSSRRYGHNSHGELYKTWMTFRGLTRVCLRNHVWEKVQIGWIHSPPLLCGQTDRQMWLNPAPGPLDWSEITIKMSEWVTNIRRLNKTTGHTKKPTCLIYCFRDWRNSSTCWLLLAPRYAISRWAS